MIIALIIIAWLACGFIAAGWFAADELEGYMDGPALFLFTLTGPIFMLMMILMRLDAGIARGWRHPFFGNTIRDGKIYWFKRPKGE